MDKFRYYILPDKIYVIHLHDNAVVEVSGQDLIATYLRTQGYI
jgi:hypothetical protein